MIKSTTNIVYGILIVTSGATLFGAAEQESVIARLIRAQKELRQLPAIECEQIESKRQQTADLRKIISGDCQRLAKLMVASLPEDQQESGEITPRTRIRFRGDVTDEQANKALVNYTILEEKAIQQARAEVVNARKQRQS